MRYLVTGGCGFIGSSLVDRLVLLGEVVVYDNLSSGKKDYIKSHIENGSIRLIEADLLDINALKGAMQGIDVVFHLAANPDIKCGISSPDVDFKQGTLATYNVLEAMRGHGVRKIVFSSSSTVFGEPSLRPTPEDYGPCAPISIYGASKLSCEGFISAYCYMFGMQGWIFRFANIVGKRATHGILVDFIEKLKKDKKILEVLGDGKQRKSYILVEDCVEGILFGFNKAKSILNIFNLGSDDDILVSDIAEILTKKLNLENIKFKYTGTRHGWQGDVPLMLLDISKMKKLGWQPMVNSRGAVEHAVDCLIKEKRVPWLI